jgi:parallel beta-helix repeat protein
VFPGIYPESVILSIAGGTSAAHIRYISDVKWGAKITGGYDRAAFRVNSGPYVDVIGFDVSNVTGTQGIEMYASGGSILGNLVHNVAGSSAGGAGIHTYPQSTVDVQILGNVVHDIGNYLNPNNWQVTHGIYIESTRAVVEDNLVYRNEAWGIHMFHTPNNDTVTNNTVFENGWGGIIVSGTSAQYTGGSGVDDYTTVSNNIIMNNGWHGGTGRGGIVEEGSTGPHNVYYNNLLWNNQFQGSTGSQINIQTGVASGNIVANPQFVNYQSDGSGNYQLSASSPAIDAGTSGGAISGFARPPKIDIQGGSRPLGANFDIGAYEYQSSPATWPWF